MKPPEPPHLRRGEQVAPVPASVSMLLSISEINPEIIWSIDSLAAVVTVVLSVLLEPLVVALVVGLVLAVSVAVLAVDDAVDDAVDAVDDMDDDVDDAVADVVSSDVVAVTVSDDVVHVLLIDTVEPRWGSDFFGGLGSARSTPWTSPESSHPNTF
eukprot:Skav202711  [mRNA]  locus=scaffold654:652704:653171:- [translate_table: standard]